MSAAKNRNGRKGSKAETPSNTTRRYGTTARVATAACPREDCRATFAADTQDQVDQAVQDHLDNAHEAPAQDGQE